MPVTRSTTSGNKVVDWTQEVNELDNQYGLFNGMNLFAGKGHATNAMIFDKNTQTNTLIPQASRKDHKGFANKERLLETFALAIPYFNHEDRITGTDVQDWRAPGTPDSMESVARLKAEKLADMKSNIQQTMEFMKIGAIKGKMVDESLNTIADMFVEFGVTQNNIDFLLGTAATEVALKVTELKRYVAKEAKAGGAIGRIEVACDPSFFDKLTTHPTIKQAYQYYTANVQPLRDNLSKFEKWGVVDSFEFKNMMFYSYDAEFVAADGVTTHKAFETDEGYSIVKGIGNANNSYRAYYGPANTLSGANKAGKEMFMYEWADPRDKYIDLEIETAPLYVLTKPQVSVRVHSSN